MGVTRFRTDPLDPSGQWPILESTYFAGFDGRVMATRVERDGSQIACIRPVSDSGKLKTVWPLSDGRSMTLTTCSLRERDEPYNLAVELARGKIGELRNQAAQWAMGGMAIPAAARKAEAEAFKLFTQAACSQASDSAGAAVIAQQAIDAACRADDELLRAYTMQRLAGHQRAGALPVVLGCGVASPPDAEGTQQFNNAFTAVEAAASWRTIEPTVGNYDWSAVDTVIQWAASEGLMVRGGPLLDFREGAMPDWLTKWSEDTPSLQSFLCDFVETAVARYRGSVKFWEVCVGACEGGAFRLDEEVRLGLTARLIEAARRADDDSHVAVRVSSPWGIYRRDGDHRLSPMQFVDALSRSNLGLGQINLELDLVETVRDDATRSLSDVSRLIDTWSLHGLPLHVTIRAASGDQAGTSGETLLRWVNDYVPLLMAKPTVTGVFWSRFSDESGRPPTGLLDAQGQAKPTYDVFRRFRTAQL